MSLILLFDSFFGCFSPLAEFLIMDESIQTGQKILKSPARPESREIKQINFTKIFFSNIFIQKLLFCEIDFQKKNMIIDENAFHSFLWSLTIIFPQDFCFSMELINRVGIIVHIVQPVNRP